jgi:WD40 repeat protein
VATYDLHKPVWKAAYSVLSNAYYVVHTKDKNIAISVLKRLPTSAPEETGSINLPNIHGTCKDLQVSASGEILACLIGKSLLYCTLSKEPIEMLQYDHEVTLISLAIAPNDAELATGDIVGKLCLWHINEPSKPTKATHHWHAHALECLAYQPEGAILYSGGHEGVLVLWHGNTHERTYVSKLPSKLLSLSPSKDGTTLAICLANNTMKVMK